VRTVFDDAIKVALKPPKPNKKQHLQRIYVFLWHDYEQLNIEQLHMHTCSRMYSRVY